MLTPDLLKIQYSLQEQWPVFLHENKHFCSLWCQSVPLFVHNVGGCTEQSLAFYTCARGTKELSGSGSKVRKLIPVDSPAIVRVFWGSNCSLSKKSMHLSSSSCVACFTWILTLLQNLSNSFIKLRLLGGGGGGDPAAADVPAAVSNPGASSAGSEASDAALQVSFLKFLSECIFHMLYGVCTWKVSETKI